MGSVGDNIRNAFESAFLERIDPDASRAIADQFAECVVFFDISACTLDISGARAFLPGKDEQDKTLVTRESGVTLFLISSFVI